MKSIINLNQLLKCSAFLGTSKTEWNSYMNTFILGSHYDINIINLKYTLFLFKKSLKILSISTKNSGYVLIYVTEKFAKLLNVKYLLLLENLFFVTDWLNGYLTNKKIFKAFFPNMVLLVNSKNYVTITREGAYSGIPTVSFVNTDMNPLLVDYFIPMNTNSLELLRFYLNLIFFYLLVLKRELIVKVFKSGLLKCLDIKYY